MSFWGNKYPAALRLDNITVGGLIAVCPGKKHAWFEAVLPGFDRAVRVRKPVAKGTAYRRAVPAVVVGVDPAVAGGDKTEVAVISADYNTTKPSLLMRLWRWVVRLLARFIEA